MYPETLTPKEVYADSKDYAYDQVNKGYADTQWIMDHVDKEAMGEALMHVYNGYNMDTVIRHLMSEAIDNAVEAYANEVAHTQERRYYGEVR